MDEIRDAIWFTCKTGEIVGIVMVRDKITKENKAYIGVAGGKNVYIDQEVIAEYGTPIHPQTLKRLTAHFNTDPKQ